MPKRRLDSAQFDLSSSAFAVAVPSDTEDLAWITRRLEVAVSGTVKVTTEEGDVVTLPAMEDGHIFHVRVSRVWDTGTTATGILVVY